MSRLKMLINNEEVVCNKEFTITEEILTTSSTILNNCYPKVGKMIKIIFLDFIILKIILNVRYIKMMYLFLRSSKEFW